MAAAQLQDQGKSTANNMHQVKTALIGTWGTGSAFGSVAVSLESSIEAWMRISVLFVGLVSAIISAYWVIRINRVKLQRENDQLCDACRTGHIPACCPIPVSQRPNDCPLS